MRLPKASGPTLLSFVLGVCVACGTAPPYPPGTVSSSESGAGTSGGGSSASGAGSGASGASGVQGATGSSGSATGTMSPPITTSGSSTTGPVALDASAASGIPGGGVSDASASSDGGTFSLAWQDDFNTFDASLWQLESFTFGGNLAQFTPQNAAAANGILTINLTPEPSDTAEPYRGVEMRSLKTITYGKVDARVRFAKGAGVVSGLVLIYTPYPADNWNEIDIEHLGKTSTSSQLNCQVYVGPTLTPPVTQSVTPTPDPQIVPLGFDAEADFHEYVMEWTPSGVRFFADGVLLRDWTKQIGRMNLPQNVLFTIWASSSASWAGALTSASAPTSADIDWIKVYNWTP